MRKLGNLNNQPPFLLGRGVVISFPPFQAGGLFVSEETLTVNVRRQITLRTIDSEVT
jgi:hypothetical protein